MRRSLMAGVAAAALMWWVPAQAATLSVAPLADAQVVPQSISDPCIICATNVGAQPAGFGFNNFDSTGNDSSFNLFSSNLTQAFGNDVQGTPYTGTQLINLLTALGDSTLTFGVAIDVNSTAAKSEVLDQFRLIDLTQGVVLFDLAGSVALPDIRNGNGSADYLITGFNLLGGGVFQPGDNLIFQATWHGAVDGGESFYIVPIVSQIDVPEPGSLWLLGSMLSIGGIAGWWKRRRTGNTALPA